MAEYYIPFTMERNHNEAVTFQLKISERPNIVTNVSQVSVAVQFKSTASEEIRDYDYEVKVTVNGNTLVDDHFYNRVLWPKNDYDTLHSESVSITHDANGEGPLSVYAEIKADESILSLMIPLTKGSATFSGTLTPIDLSAPVISDVTVSANRYGVDAGANIITEHSSYAISSVEFSLYGLTYEQAVARNTSGYKFSSDGTYEIIKKKTSGLSQKNEIFFDLDTFQDKNPLNSGTHYSYSVTVTAENGKTATSKGSFYVPQKVIGLTCDSLIDTSLGLKTALNYQVLPQNAEYPAVEIVSSNEKVATVDSNGNVYAEGEGVCQITVTTLDGGFDAVCTVNVFDTERFPQLSNVRYLSNDTVIKITSACSFLRQKLTDKGISVPTLPLILFEGRTHPIKEIRSLLETVETCCQILKSAANAVYPCSSLQNEQYFLKNNTDSQWYFVVNEWINFLNELNEKLSKEA